MLNIDVTLFIEVGTKVTDFNLVQPLNIEIISVTVDQPEGIVKDVKDTQFKNIEANDTEPIVCGSVT